MAAEADGGENTIQPQIVKVELDSSDGEEEFIQNNESIPEHFGMEGENENEEGAPTIKMTKNLLEFLRQVTNVSAYPQVVDALQQQRITPPDSPNSSLSDESARRNASQRCQLSHGEKHEVAQFMTDNPNVKPEDVAILFSVKLKKDVSLNIIRTIQKGDKWLEESLRDSNKYKIRSSAFPEIEDRIVLLLDEAEKSGSTLSSKFIRTKALEVANELRIPNFNASKGWLLKLLSRQNRKLGRSVEHLQKRKPFIRLSFGEKHVIAKYIKEYPNKTYPEYAKYFSELWERNVTARQIITTKENMEKWLNEAYKDCHQTHYKFVDEGSETNGPMVMKRKRSRVMLTPEEREEISNYLADNSHMTFNQIAEIFAKRWSKDVNRTHVASIMRLREKNFADSTPKKVKPMPHSLMPAHSSPGGFDTGPNMIPFGSLSSLSFPPSDSMTSSVIRPPMTSSPQLPMSGIDLLRLVDNDEKTKQPITSASLLHSSPPSVSRAPMNPGLPFFGRNGLTGPILSRPNSKGFTCENCGRSFESHAQLVSHVLTTPDCVMAFSRPGPQGQNPNPLSFPANSVIKMAGFGNSQKFEQ